MIYKVLVALQRTGRSGHERVRFWLAGDGTDSGEEFQTQDLQNAIDRAQGIRSDDRAAWVVVHTAELPMGTCDRCGALEIPHHAFILNEKGV